MKCILLKWLAASLLFICCFTSTKLHAQIATIGTGTDTWNNFNPVSIGGWSQTDKNVHIQMIYTAAEINAGGVTGARMLDSIAWEVASVPAAALKSYTIKLRNTGLNTMDSFIATQLTQVVNLPTFMPVKGWSWIKFQTPFYWNGSDNLLLDICTDTLTAKTGSGTVYMSYIDDKFQWFSEYGAKPLCGVYKGTNAYADGYKANIKMSFRAAPVCTGTPVTGTIMPSTAITGCAGFSTFLELTNAPTTNVKLQWQRSVDGGAWGDVAANGTGYMATIVPNAQYVDYRVQMTCVASSQSSTSNAVRLNRAGTPKYAALPYFQGFENWESKCAVKDVPDSFWSAWPATGISSWRREDEGLTADWKEDVVPNYYYPVSSEKSHSARFQCSKNQKTSGGLSLFLNCDGPGLKEARFDFMIKTMLGGANIFVLLSKDGGGTFDTITTLDAAGVRAEWLGYVLPINSTSATTVLKFVGYGAYTQSMDFDLGIDNLYVYPTCAEKPVAGTVDSLVACKGEGITLSLSGTSKSGGLTWLWQKTTDGISWVDVVGGGIERPNASIDEPTWFRCIVTCTNSGMSDTSEPRLIKLKSFYQCYCSSSSTVASPYINIGNVQLSSNTGGPLLLDNGNPLPGTENLNARQHYSDFTSLPPVDFFKDSTYKLKLTFFTENGKWASPTMSGTYSKVFIDYNHNQKFDDNEMVWEHVKADDLFTDSGTFKVPLNAEVGITAMRIVSNMDAVYDSTAITACGPYSYGETEDYLVRISNGPCNGNEVPGVVNATDTSFCPGYPFTITLRDADSTTGMISRNWQSSLDGVNWTDIANSNDEPEWSSVFAAATYYRVKAVCARNSVAFYTDSVRIGQDALCYCPSYATGGFAGAADSSDFGSFKFASFNFPLTGGHLNNALAVNKYRSYTHLPAPVLYADSTYNFSLDHILVRNTHADAKITLFIDYNGNGTYDIPAERVYSSISTSSTWHQSGNIIIPSDVVLDKETGMRLIINNDTAANIPSDEACGTYVSGETEDYRVSFKKGEVIVGIGKVTELQHAIAIYPNPSTGIVSVQYKGNNLGNGVLKVHNVAGQLLETLDFQKLISGSVLQLNLGNYSSGIYFITLESGGSIATGKVVVQ